MDQFNFQGDITGVNARHLEFVSGVLRKRGFKNQNVHIESVGKPGDGTIGIMKRFIINKDGEGGPFKMVAKIAPSFKNIRMKTESIFDKEHIVYTELLPKFAELEKEINLPESDRLRFATCYGSSIEEPNEILLLEDLCESNFTMLDKFKPLPSDTVKLVLRSLAFLHSLSYVLKHKEPETYDAFGKRFITNWEIVKDMDSMITYMNQLENDVISMLDNDKHKNVVKGLLNHMISNGLKTTEFYKQSNYSVIQQGDVWINNIMFKLEGEKAMECCMLDYQITSISSPASDILYMIFNSTDYETRSQHYYEWIDYYHNEMEKRLSVFGLMPNNFYTRDLLDADLRTQAKVLFAQVAMATSVIVRESSEVVDLISNLVNEDVTILKDDVSKISTKDSSGKTRFKNRIEGMVKSFLELGYL